VADQSLISPFLGGNFFLISVWRVLTPDTWCTVQTTKRFHQPAVVIRASLTFSWFLKHDFVDWIVFHKVNWLKDYSPRFEQVKVVSWACHMFAWYNHWFATNDLSKCLCSFWFILWCDFDVCLDADLAERSTSFNFSFSVFSLMRFVFNHASHSRNCSAHFLASLDSRIGF